MVKDLIGTVFGRFCVVGKGPRNKAGGQTWECLCSCGETRYMCAHPIVNEIRLSCGCARKDTPAHNKTHGQTRTPIFNAWRAMLARCYNPKHIAYASYGGRGITVCERWKSKRQGSVNFISDMGPRPDKLTLERIDNSKGYSPDNCVWATMQAQSSNRRNNVKLTVEGATKTQAEWAKLLGVADSVVAERIKRGWSIKDSTTLPAGKQSKAAKLTDNQVLTIRANKEQKSIQELAAMYNVGRTAIWNILRKVSFKHLE